MAPTKPKKMKEELLLGEITRPSTASSSLKIGSPSIRVGLEDANSPKQKSIKVPSIKVGRMVGPKPTKTK